MNKEQLEKLIKKEGDYKAFEYKGYKCRILRLHRIVDSDSTLIYLCGYVFLEKGDVFFGEDYNDIDVSVHGGLTYSEDNLRYNKQGWWIGFDCAHAYDLTMLDDDMNMYSRVKYRDMVYVENELKSLVDQLIEANLEVKNN